MTEWQDMLAKIYALRIDRGGKRLPVIEQHLDIIRPAEISTDDRRNERFIYQRLFEMAPDGLNEFLNELMDDLRGVAYEHSGGILDALGFLQSVLASALWKHHMPVSARLDEFVRDFDRLDVPDVRRRLYERARMSEHA